MVKKCDFSGWATKANLLCSDGRIIMKDAFKHCDGATVPLVWNHQHNSPEEVLGHAVLENREEGVYAYCSFNNTESGQAAKECVLHGDVNQLSIYANKLKHQGCNVIHGMIREVSLVLAGANPGAFIDSIAVHSDDSEGEGYIYTGEYIDAEPIYHADTADKAEKGEDKVATETKNQSENKTIGDVLKTLNEEQLEAVYAIIGQLAEDKEVKHADEDSEEVTAEASEETNDEEEVKHADEESAEKTVQDVLDTLNEEQETVVYGIIGELLGEDDDEEDEAGEVKHADAEEGGKTVQEVLDTLNEEQQKVFYSIVGQLLPDEEDDTEEEVQHSDEFEGGNDTMKTNVFDQTQGTQMGETLSHSEMKAIMDDAKRNGSLKDAVLAHGIEDLDVIFPDHKALANEPEFIKRNDDWVAKVLGGVHHTPFSRIKSIFADVTAAQARAKGYQKGNMKIEEVFKLLKRVTNPTTIYKKQKLDRDDIIDIDWNVLPFLKKEIRMMLYEELARAILIGDGRDPVEEANDKIDEECIRPIWKMEDLFTVKVAVPVAAEATADAKAKAFIKACIKSRKQYQGSGNPSMFMSEDMLADCLLIEDANERVIYDTVDKLAAVLRVKEIIPVPVMDGVTRKDEDEKVFELAAIYVNLNDYNVGADKGGEINFFDDFDIDYNQMKYLMETRCSGSLVKPHSAVAIEFTQA